MSELTEQLREAAKCAPLWGSIFKVAADEIERLQGAQNKIKAEAVREAFEKAEIPAGAKAGCIGEFSVHIENGQVCPECYMSGDSPDCELCHGESVDGLSDLVVGIPWVDQKEIFKAFCKFSAMDAKDKLERGEL